MRKTPRTVLEGEGTFPPYPVFNSKTLQNLTPWFPLLLFVISVGIYFQNIYHDFTYDDHIWVLDDPRIWNWDIWAFIFESGNRWPLVVRPLTFMLDYALFGVSPFGYQIHNLIWNSLCVILVFFLLRKLTQEATLSFFGALIFAIHPIHVEAVSNITNRKELLALAFVLMAFLCYARFLEEHHPRKWLWFLGSGIAWGLGLCSKQVAVVLPALLVAYEMLLVPRHQRFIAKNIKLLLGLIGVVSLPLLYYVVFVLDVSNFQDSRVLTYTLKGYLGDLTYPAMIATSARAFWSYIQLLVWPSGMCPNYIVELSPSFLEFRALVAWVGLILYLTIALAASLRWPLLAFGMLWFFIGFMPISNWLPSSYILADRYMFMPSVGYCIVLVALGRAIFQWFGRTHPQKAIGIASVLAISVTIGYGSTTLAYNQHWGNQETLMKYMLQCNPISPQAYNGLGNYYLDQGKLSEAVRLFSRAIELGNATAYGNRANAYYQLGQYEAALNDYNQVIRLDDYTKARSLEFTWVRPFNNRGTVFFELGNYEAALKDYQMAISLNPDWGEPYYNRGILYLSQHKYEMAVEDFTRALQRVREGSRVLNARGVAYEKLGNWRKAREDYSQAILLDSSNGEAFFNLGRVQLHDDELEAAIRSYRTAQQLGWERAEAVLKVLRKKGYLKE